MATKPQEPERRALPPRKSTRPGIAKRRPRRQSVPMPITILDRRQYLDFKGEGGRALLSKERVADCIEVILTLLDIAERDHDLEETGNEDSFEDLNNRVMTSGPGCPVADPPGETDMDLEPSAWTERVNQSRGLPHSSPSHEDEEEDDPLEANGDEKDGSNCSEDEFMHHGGGWAAGCPVADPDLCLAGDDKGTASGDSDGAPGDPEDAEDGGDTELNGDEGDYDEGVPV